MLSKILYSIVFAGLGMWMIFQPEGIDPSEASGRNRGRAELLNSIWGTPAAVILLIAALTTFTLAFKPQN